MECNNDRTRRISWYGHTWRALPLAILLFASLPLRADDGCAAVVVDWVNDAGKITRSYGCVSVDEDKLLMAQNLVAGQIPKRFAIPFDETLAITFLVEVELDQEGLEPASFQKVGYHTYIAKRLPRRIGRVEAAAFQAKLRQAR